MEFVRFSLKSSLRWFIRYGGTKWTFTSHASVLIMWCWQAWLSFSDSLALLPYGLTWVLSVFFIAWRAKEALDRRHQHAPLTVHQVFNAFWPELFAGCLICNGFCWDLKLSRKTSPLLWLPLSAGFMRFDISNMLEQCYASRFPRRWIHGYLSHLSRHESRCVTSVCLDNDGAKGTTKINNQHPLRVSFHPILWISICVKDQQWS
jgi:hypothetical protein